MESDVRKQEEELATLVDDLISAIIDEEELDEVAELLFKGNSWGQTT